MSLTDKTKKWLDANCNISLKGKTVLVTGANSGVGFKTAEIALYLGANVILACRSTEKAAAARATLLRDKYYAHMDLASSKDYTGFFAENEVKMDEIDDLLNLNFTICNCINVLLNGTTLMHNVMHPGSLEGLAKYAEKGRQMEVSFYEQIQ